MKNYSVIAGSAVCLLSVLYCCDRKLGHGLFTMFETTERTSSRTGDTVISDNLVARFLDSAWSYENIRKKFPSAKVRKEAVNNKQYNKIDSLITFYEGADLLQFYKSTDDRGGSIFLLKAHLASNYFLSDTDIKIGCDKNIIMQSLKCNNATDTLVVQDFTEGSQLSFFFPALH